MKIMSRSGLCESGQSVIAILFISVNVDILLYRNINEINITADLKDCPQVWLKTETILIKKLYKNKPIFSA